MTSFKPTDSLISEYLNLQEKYQKKWGEKTIVLMEVGSFFEIYGVVNDTEKRGIIYEISEFTNLNVSKKNSKTEPVSIKNPLMAGFPNYSVKKWEDILLKHDYTIIKIEQDCHGNSNPNRNITEIRSPGINLESHNFTNTMMSLFFEEYQDSKSGHSILQLGLSVIDINTGHIWVYETHSEINDYNFCLDESFRYIQSFNPMEIIIHTLNTKLTKYDIINYLEISNYTIHFNLYSENNELLSNSNKNFMLKKVYPDTGVLSPVEYIDMERMFFSLNSLIYLLQFSYEHNETIIDRLKKPFLCEPEKYLTLSHDSVIQLNVISNKNTELKQEKSLWTILDKTKTVLGKRFLKHNLLNPLIDTEELNDRYLLVESFIEKDMYDTIRNNLKYIVDIERLHRKMAMGIMNPYHFINLDISYQRILKIIDYIKQTKLDQKYRILPDDDILVNFKQYITNYNSKLDMKNLSEVYLNDLKKNIFKKGLYHEIDDIQDKIEYHHRWLNKFLETLNKIEFFISKNNSNVKVFELKFNEKEGHYISLTTSKFKYFKEFLSKNNDEIKFNIDNEEFVIKSDTLDIKQGKTHTKINCNQLKMISNSKSGLQEKMKKKCSDKFSELLHELHTEYHIVLDKMCASIAFIDFICNIAFVSKSNGYVKPEIINEKKSFIESIDMRHPIIEIVREEMKYIPNDINLGNDDCKGILLYGVNAVGKSSLMKSIGLNVIMAQAGFYVPCRSFKYSPYHHLFTRISNNDNIFKGQSTFAVEMSELKTILNRSNDKTLVLGDELCSGTETISAISLVTSGVIFLSKKNTSFIFATHLHKLSDMEEINNCKNVKHFHMETTYNEETKKIIYNRKLIPGSGNSIYGLEVARGMGLDKDFINCADKIRKNIMNLNDFGINNKHSNYNKQIIIDKCSICKCNTEEVHHIEEQHLADKKGMIDYFHKNSLFNLVQLCKECHHKVHYGNLSIIGYVDTNEGIELQYKDSKELDRPKKKKYTQDQIDIIKDIYSKNNNYSLTLQEVQNQIVNKYKSGKTNSISMATLKKIINNQY